MPGPGWRQCTAYRQTGPGALPTVLRLSDGLGSGWHCGCTGDVAEARLWECASGLGIARRVRWLWCHNALALAAHQHAFGLLPSAPALAPAPLNPAIAGPRLATKPRAKPCRALLPNCRSLCKKTMAFSCLTFELSGQRRQGAGPELAKMYRVPPDRARCPADGAPLERWVRPQAV